MADESVTVNGVFMPLWYPSRWYPRERAELMEDDEPVLLILSESTAEGPSFMPVPSATFPEKHVLAILSDTDPAVAVI